MDSVIVCVDLDNTLIDSVKRYNDEQIVAVKYGIDPKTYVNCVETLFKRHGNFYSYKFLLPILQETKQDINCGVQNELEALLDKQYFFDDTIAFLSAFPKARLIITTSGDPTVQIRKAMAHNLSNWCRGMIVNSNKASVVSAFSVAHQVYFVDDAPREIEKVKKQCPSATCIQVREPPPWEKQKTTDYADIKLPSLFEVAEFIFKSQT